MRYSHTTVQLLLTALCLLNTAVATSPSDFQRMDNLPNLDCTTAWDTDMPYCQDSDFENGAPCRPGCAYGVQSTQEGIQQVCQGAQYAPGSLMAQFMAGKGAGILCPNAVTTTPIGGSSETSLSVSTVSRPTSLAVPTAAASSTVTVTIQVTSSFTSSSISSTSSAPTTTIVVKSTVVTHITTKPSSNPNSTSSSTFMATPSSSSKLTPSPSSTTAPNTSGIIQTAISGASVTVQSRSKSGIIQTSANGASVTVQGGTSSGLIRTAVSGASVTVESGTSSEFIQTAVNGGSATVLSSKPAQTSSNNPDAFGGGGSPFEISSPASRLIYDLESFASFFAVGCMIWTLWV